MKKYGIILAVVMTALAATACGGGGGIVINGTTAGRSEEAQEPEGGDTEKEEADTDASVSNESMVETAAPASAGGTKIEIVTGETQPAAAHSLESQTEPMTTAAPTTAAPAMAAASTTAARSTTAAPTTKEPETTAAKTYTVTDVSKSMYASSSVRVRASYSTSSDILGALQEGEKVEITGESANGWMRVQWKGQEGYVSKSYLSDTPPATNAASENSGNGGGNTATSGGSASLSPNPTQQENASPGPGGNSGTGSSPSPSGTSSNNSSTGNTSGGSGTITGSVTALDPTGVTIRTSNGNTYSFNWGSGSIPALAPGEQIQIQYSGNTVTQVTK